MCIYDFKKYWLVIAILIVAVSGNSSAQEIRCNISISTQSIQGTNKQVFETLQTALNEFMNNQRWTEKVYGDNERIECTMLINIKEIVSADEFKGTIQIQARRPVYNSSYNSVLFNFLDNDFHIKYVEYEPLNYNQNSLESNLIGLMAYYSYIIIGMDEDSFELNGGSGSFQKAERIVNMAQNMTESGWKSFENRKNRYWLVENVLNEYHKPLRECLYKYHRLGLDQMTSNVEKSRGEIADALENLRKIHNQFPSSFLMQVFFSAKSDEIVDIFSEGSGTQKASVSELLIEIDPTNVNKYKKITANN
ncbi:MAG: DUF4835 family protein [Marinilabiliaceae bacterium]|nr:DUF4835 family protein [Marinilabiliaceae bacterium]